MIRVAMLSKWHVHADDYARQAKEHPQIDIACVWDEDPVRGGKWAEALDIPFEADLHKVLTSPNIDAVIVDTPTHLHKDIILQAAQHGKHIFTEKVLALTVEDCEEIFSAIKSAGVHWMVSLPRLTENYYLYAKQVLEQGLLGTLTSIRCQLAHNGSVSSDRFPNGWLPEHFYNLEQCGGGALVDLGAHPIYLLNRLAGKAEAVTARFQYHTGRDVEDHAIVIVEFAGGALGTIETGFLAGGCPFQLEVVGTEGTLLIEDQTVRIRSTRIEQDGWHTPEKLPNPLPMPMEQWASSILNDQKPSITKEDVVALTLINEAARRSQKENRRILIAEMERSMHA